MLPDYFFYAGLGLVLLLLYVNRRPKNFPKGPFSWPILGHLPLLARKAKNGDMHLLFLELSKKYGKALSINFASFPAIILHDHELIKEAWNNSACCGRPKLHAARERTGGISRGLMFQDGEEWTEQRRFALRHLRDFGFGRKSMESLILDEVDELIQGLKRDAGTPISTQNRFNITVINALWQITAGERFHHDDPQLTDIMAAITRNVTGTPASRAAFFMPWLVKLAPKLCGWEKYKADLPYTYNFLQKYVKSRLQTYEGNQPQNFTDVFIDEIRKTTDPTSSFYGHRGELTLTATLQDIFVAGAETTSTTLTWICLYMALFPDKQKKLRDEIDTLVGSRPPSLDDKPSMLYTESVVLETLRFASMVPMGLFHRATEDVQLGPYHVPKNTFILANLHAVHHDPEYWGDPENFRPERFLAKDGQSIVKHEAFLPFSWGKRYCLGMNLALIELFLLVTHIFQNFEVTWDPSGPKPGLGQVSSVIAAPKPHKLVFNQRVTKDV